MCIRHSAMVVALTLAVVVPLGHSGAQSAPTDSAPRITFGGFVDGYFAWDFGRPPAFDRSFAGGTLFTTQPTRHNEFNINLAYIEVKLEATHYRGRLALQTGTSVQSNYSGEPTIGRVSGPSLSRMVQEAVVGMQVARNVWVDAGVFFSHLGMEGWVSRDGPTYTRSLVADYSPYYQSGVKLTWTASPKLTLQLHVVNGWQNISENNRGKGVGMRFDLVPTSATTLSYYNLLSAEAGTRLRTFNGVGLKHTLGALTLLGQFDLGSQSRGSGVVGSSIWHGWTAIARVQTAPRVALSVRVEGYTDADQVIMATGSRDVNGSPMSNPAFRGLGASAGVDISPYARVLWRTELRGWQNRDALFPDGATGAPSKSNAFLVTSWALTF